MSFSNEVRNELARIIPEKECCIKAELLALMAVNGVTVDIGEGNTLLRGIAENAATARKMYKLLKEAYQLQVSVRIIKQKRFHKQHIYEVNSVLKADRLWIARELNIRSDQEYCNYEDNSHLIRKSCCKRAYLRGIFLSRGFVNRPEVDYHLEIVVNDRWLAAEIQELLDKFALEARGIERKNHLVIYIKESDKIADFLRVVGASKALLDFENVRIIKSMRNDVNRQVNCETANLSKTINASLRQTELIKRLAASNGLETLSPQLRELALARIKYPDYSLKELGAAMNPPLSKSGVAYRMRKLENHIEDLSYMEYKE
ncbi:MAG: DNA-binding protein WhiA [Syntrophomonadaceae bacterium]|nr:DNA-binding protein WhiA [Syntrophomonadaceae bacterium]MDD3023880.1 DNA-binding protein WhiA [Syntrophomonadaceae bacterium]